MGKLNDREGEDEDLGPGIESEGTLGWGQTAREGRYKTRGEGWLRCYDDEAWPGLTPSYTLVGRTVHIHLF